MIQFERYVGRAYDADTSNCWHLLREVYIDHLGVELPSYQGDYAGGADHEGISAIVARVASQWLEVPLAEAAQFDLLLAWIRNKDKPPTHVGVVIGPSTMLSNYHPRARIDDYTGDFWGKRIAHCYRYTGSSHP